MLFYDQLADWWPVISPVEDYADEMPWIVSLLPAPGASVLELGCGGGHVAHHLAASYEMTLTDFSPRMLDVSRRLNPGAEHIHGDMRELRLGRRFDAVLAHDAIAYMTTRDDLAAVARTGFEHCADGGVTVLIPDDVAESFAERTELDEHDAADGRSARLLSWTWDPDPTDEMVRTDFSFLLRTRSGEVVAEHEAHEFGLFSVATWIETLRGAGFSQVTAVDEPGGGRTAFVARR